MKPQENFSGKNPSIKSFLSHVAVDKKEKDDFLKVKSLIELLYNVLEVYGYDNEPNLGEGCKNYQDKIRLRDRYLEFVKLAGFGSWKDLFKYKINAFFSYVMEQEVPPAPKGLEKFSDLINPSFMFYGRAKRFLGILKKDRNRDKLVNFAQTIAQSKKGAPPVHDDVVAAAETKTFLQLTTEPTQSADFTIFDGIWNCPVNRGSIEFELRRTVFEVDWSELTLDDLQKPFFPSTSAQYNWGRGTMGAVASVVYACKEAFTNVPDVLIDKKLGKVTLKGQFSDEYGLKGREEQSEMDKNALENGIPEKETIGLHFDDSNLVQHWKTHVWPTMLEKALEEEPRTLCIGLPEPLKVRVITAGPSLTYSILKPFQKWLWKNLKNLPAFRLIGEPITAEIVCESLGKLEDDEELISGDYVASTDNLHSWVSNCIANAIREVLYKTSSALGEALIEKLFILLKRALTGHLIMDPIHTAQYRKDLAQYNRFDPNLIPREWFKEQKEGQLMGSIVSFPILCIANGAACRYAMEISSRKKYCLNPRYVKYGYVKCPSLFNGDDCALKGRSRQSATIDLPALFPTWKAVTAYIGLSSSVGKTFVSNQFVTMNSEQFSYESHILSREEFDAGTRDFSYTTVKYVNFGLVYGQSKDGIRAKGSNRMGPLHHDLWKTCPPEYFIKASEIFMKINKTAINLYNIPKFVPEWLGGLGLIPWKRNQVSEAELLCSGIIRQNLNLPEQNFFHPKMLMEDREWLLHQLTKDFNKEYDFLGSHSWVDVEFDGIKRSLEAEDSKYYASLIMEVFIRYGISVTTCKYQELEPGLKRIRSVEVPNTVPVINKDGSSGRERVVETFNGGFKSFHMKSKIHKAYKHNERLWTFLKESVRTDSAFAESWSRGKLDITELFYEKKKSYLCCFDVRKASLTVPHRDEYFLWKQAQGKLLEADSGRTLEGW